MGDEKDAFYVVRKGDVVGIYKTFADCQAQVSFSPLDPSISIFKGYGLSKEIELYFVSRGLQQASFSISASDLQDGLFGPLSVCPFQNVGGSSCHTVSPPRKSIKLEHYVDPQACGDPVHVADPAFNGRIEKHVDTGLNKSPANLKQHSSKVDTGLSKSPANPKQHYYESMNDIQPANAVRPACQSCTLEFDGASKGNPGLAGAGAVLRAKDGSQVWLLREGVGIATNNVAEYRSVILGLRTALQKGFRHVTVRGDSLLVCNQIMGKWKTKNENMASLCKDALLLKKQFQSFTIEHVPRDFNSAADTQANRAITLKNKQVEIESM